MAKKKYRILLFGRIIILQEKKQKIKQRTNRPKIFPILKAKIITVFKIQKANIPIKNNLIIKTIIGNDLHLTTDDNHSGNRTSDEF